jgi:cell division protein FtsQ
VTDTRTRPSADDDAPPRLRMDPRIRERRVAVARDAGRRRLRILAIVGGAFGLVAGAYGITRTPLFDVDHVRVEGAAQTGTPQLLEASGLAGHPQLADVKPPAVVAKLERLPWVQEAQVVRHWPGTVEVKVVERIPMATLPAAGGGWALVDDTGRVLGVTPTPLDGLVQLASAPAPPPGDEVPPATLGGLTLLDALPPSLSERVNGLTIADDGVIDVHAVGLPVIHFGPPTSVRAKLVALTTLVARTNLKGATAIDVRVPTAPVLTRS